MSQYDLSGRALVPRQGLHRGNVRPGIQQLGYERAPQVMGRARLDARLVAPPLEAVHEGLRSHGAGLDTRGLVDGAQ